MLFNSIEFFIFFPIVTAVFFAMPERLRKSWLLGASCVFYMVLIPAYILILFFTIGIDFWAGLAIARSTGRRRKLYLWASIAANVGVLVIFKYAFFIASTGNAILSLAGLPPDVPLLRILLPVGLSFHTFQAMSYTIEVYKGRYPPETSLMTYALYVMFFPQLVAGPIERPQHLLPQLQFFRDFDAAEATIGLRLMLWGFVKKVFVADRLAPYVNEVFNQPLHSSTAHIVAAIFFAFQIYCDFSGYSDIAIGAGRVLGVNLMRNFREPYLASTLSDFWHRWHISLSTWFRDYVYIPLGGNRGSALRSGVNLLAVFLISGLWHGASWTFVAWGGIHGLLLLGERGLSWIRQNLRLPPLPKSAARLATFSIVTLAWVFFRADTIEEAVSFTGKMLSLSGFPRGILAPLGGMAGFQDFVLMWIGIGTVLLGDMVANRWDSVPDAIAARPRWQRWTFYYAATAALLLFGAWGKREFIYFQF